jgi:subtilisin family serine protease
LRRLKAIGALRYAHANPRVRPSSQSATRGDPADPAPWWLPQIGADRVVPPGAGFPLTIVDDGLDLTHPEFVARPVRFLNESEIVYLEDYHGTMMGSVAAAPVNGVGIAGLYPQVALRVADTGAGDCADVIAAVERAVAAGPSVLNMSWGFSPPACFAVQEQLVRAFAAGLLPVAAAGNMRLHLNPPSVPAIWPHVLTVGSTSPRERVSYFSNTGQGIDVAAPGESIVAATPTFFEPKGYAELEGTSFSASIVSAAAAWVATRRRMDVTQLSELLRTTARDVSRAGWDEFTGFGIVDLPSALTKPIPAADPLEPNDDVHHVSAGRLFKEAAPPLTRPGKETTSLEARLDRREDPVDVYRLFVPARRSVTLRVTPDSNVNVEVFRPNARTCYYKNRRAALRSTLIRGGYRLGQAVESVVVPAKPRDRYVYACVFKPRDEIQTASYVLAVSTTNR